MGDIRARTRAALGLLFAHDAQGLAPDCRLDVSAPAAPIGGRDAVLARFVAPLRRAFAGLHRREIIVIGGDSAVGGGTWVAILGHYVGTFVAPFCGIRPSGHLAFLRAGEFWRIEGGRIAAGRILLDLPDLMRQAGRPAFPRPLGTEIAFPAPATQDGLCPDPAGGADSLAVIERLIATLHDYDAVTFGSAGQTGPGGIWADGMMWYGPAGIGSNHRWEGFVADHRAPFLRAFPDRRGGNHYARFGDGPYAAMSGWPSMTMTHRGDYLGVPATGRSLTLRVMDFYRIAGGRIAENWVLLDYVDLFAQMGVDLIARGHSGPG